MEQENKLLKVDINIPDDPEKTKWEMEKSGEIEKGIISENSSNIILPSTLGDLKYIFKDILDYLKPGDCLVRNNTKVLPARLYGQKETAQIASALLVKEKLYFRHADLEYKSTLYRFMLLISPE